MTLNDTQASRKIAQPLQVAIAITLGRPKGNGLEARSDTKRAGLSGGPARLQFVFPSPRVHSLQAHAPHFSLAETGMRSQVQSMGTASLPGAGEVNQ